MTDEEGNQQDNGRQRASCQCLKQAPNNSKAQAWVQDSTTKQHSWLIEYAATAQLVV